MSKTLSLVIMISGNGSNLQSIIDAIEDGRLDAEIKAVICNVPGAYGLVRATKHDLHTWVIDHRDYPERERFDDLLQHHLQSINPDFIVLAGFMRILGPRFIKTFENRILNIHPSLLPAYKGLDTLQRALQNNETEHGVSIHLVTAELDDGQVLLQARYPIEPDDSVEDLQQKGHRLEHQMYPELLSWFAQGKLTIKGGQVFHEQALLTTPLIFNS